MSDHPKSPPDKGHTAPPEQQTALLQTPTSAREPTRLLDHPVRSQTPPHAQTQDPSPHQTPKEPPKQLSISAIQNARRMLNQLVDATGQRKVRQPPDGVNPNANTRRPIISEDKKRQRRSPNTGGSNNVGSPAGVAPAGWFGRLWARLTDLFRKEDPKQIAAEEERRERARLERIRLERAHWEGLRARPLNVGERGLHEIDFDPENSMQRVVGKDGWNGRRNHRLNSLRQAGLPADFDLEREKTHEKVIGREKWQARGAHAHNELRRAEFDTGMLKPDRTVEGVIGKDGWQGQRKNQLNSIRHAGIETGMFKPDRTVDGVIGKDGWQGRREHLLNSIKQALVDTGMFKPETSIEGVVGRQGWWAHLPNELNDFLNAAHLSDYDLEDIYQQIMDPSWKLSENGPDWYFLEVQHEQEGIFRVDRPIDYNRSTPFADIEEEEQREWFDEEEGDWFDEDSAEFPSEASGDWGEYRRDSVWGAGDVDEWQEEGGWQEEGDGMEEYLELDEPGRQILWGDGRGHRLPASERPLPPVRRGVSRDRPVSAKNVGYVVDDIYRPIQKADHRQYEVHIVQKGESLEHLALLYEVSLEALLQFNPQLNAHGRHIRIYPGQPVYIPR